MQLMDVMCTLILYQILISRKKANTQQLTLFITGTLHGKNVLREYVHGVAFDAGGQMTTMEALPSLPSSELVSMPTWLDVANCWTRMDTICFFPAVASWTALSEFFVL